MSFRAAVIIPAYNEAGRILRVIEKVKAKGLPVLVVNDGSDDDTAAVASQAGANVISLSSNQGKGAAIREGLSCFLKENYDGIILMDADEQHDPNDLRCFVEALESQNGDLILGNRMASPENMPWIRRVTNRVMSFIISSASGQKIPDSQCGFRALHRHVVEKIRIKTNRFEAESEMILDAARHGFTIRSIPVASVYAGEHSHIHPIRDTFRFFRFLFSRLLE